MKKKSLIAPLVFLLVLSNMYLAFAADKPDALPVYVNSPYPYVDNDLDEEFGDRVTWSNYTKLFYIFTDFNASVVRASTRWYLIGKAHSADGVNWNVDADYFDTIDHRAASNKERFDFTLSPDHRYIWFAWIVSQTVYIVKCELFLNGSVIRLEANQIVYPDPISGSYYVDTGVQIEVDENGRPFVAVGYVITGIYGTYVRWSNLTNGTWIQDGHQSFDSLMVYNKGDWYPEHSKLHRLAEGRMAWTMTYRRNIGINAWATDTAYFNGINWVYDTEELFEDAFASGVAYPRFDVVSYGDELVAVYDFDSFNHFLYAERKTGNGAWGDQQLLGTFGTKRNPSLTVDPDGNVYLFLLTDGGDHVNYTVRYSNYTWSGNWINFYDNNSQVFNWNQFSCPDNFMNYAPIVYHDNSYADTEILFDYLAWDGDYIPVVMQHFNTTLYNQDMTVNDGWIFEGEVYNLVSYIQNASSFYVNTTDSRHQIRFKWNNETSQTWISVNPADQFTIGLPWTNYTRYDNEVVRIQWRFIPDRSIIDCVNETWGYYIENDHYAVNQTGALSFNSHIYNLGGLTYYTFQGDGGRITGGHPWELHATNGTEGSSARAEQIYRKLQHIHFLIEIDMDNEWDAGAGEFDILDGIDSCGFVDIGIDYHLNGTWVEGFYVRLYVYDAEVGHDNAGTDENYVEWSVDWYNYDPSTGYPQNLRTGYIYSNHWGYENENLDPDYHNRTSCQLWIDLWFDRTNASTAIAGQINSMYYGYKEHGNSWWPGYGVFQPMRGEYENAMFLDDLYDEGGNVTDSMKFDLMRVFIEVEKISHPDGDDETWTIRAIENINRKLADDRMQGIEQPAFEETLVLEMPMFQSLNPLVRAIDGIASAVWKGALGFQKILWGAMDSFFAWAGFGEGFFSTITAFLMAIPELFVKMMENIPLLIQNMVELVEDVFGMVVMTLPEFVLGIGWLTESVMNYWTTLTNFFTGGILPINIIQDLQLGDWIRAGFTLLPSYELFSIIWAKDSGKKAKERIDFYSMLFNGVINFVKGAISFMQQAIQTIMDILPG